MSARRLTLAVAGHVDHGKTAVSLALTGVDTDRLPEERRRGLSIRPGFAELPLPSGRPASLVDLPGHERFVRHMIAGSAGVDAALLCVAADDGPMPQTREHLDVLGLLDVPVAAVAVTFADRADPGPASVAAAELVSAPAVPVVAPDGTGVEDLRRALDAALAPRAAPCRGEARLPVDRAFTVAGAGTVVTGTLLGVGGLAAGEAVRVEPSGAAGRVRRIEVHDGAVERAVRGRVALNLGGIARDDAPPGSAVVPAGSPLRAVDRIEVDLVHLPASPRALRGRERLPAFVGTAEVTARLRLRGLPRLDPGRRATVELRLERPACVAVGDRVLVRTPDPLTVAGGVVVAVGPAPAARREAQAAREPGAADGGEVAAAEAALRAAGPAGTPTGDIPAGARAALRRLGRAGEARGLWFHEEAIARAEAEALDSWRDDPRTLGDLRACWGVSRRSAEALANLLDARGVTRRVGAVRVLRRGARARTPAP